MPSCSTLISGPDDDDDCARRWSATTAAAPAPRRRLSMASNVFFAFASSPKPKPELVVVAVLVAIEVVLVEVVVIVVVVECNDASSTILSDAPLILLGAVDALLFILIPFDNIFDNASFTCIRRSTFRNKATAKSFTTTFQCNAIICELVELPSFNPISSGGNATNWLLAKRVLRKSTFCWTDSSKESKMNRRIMGALTNKSSPTPRYTFSHSRSPAYSRVHWSKFSSARFKSLLSWQSRRLNTPITADVCLCGSRSPHGSKVVDFFTPFFSDTFMPTRSVAIRHLFARPSKMRIRWHPDCQSCPRNGVALYFQSPGGVSWECGSINVTGSSSSSASL